MRRSSYHDRVREWLVAGALIERDGDLLLVANRRHNGTIDWTPPGGVIEAGDETVLHGLTREVLEETGLVVTGWDGPCYEVHVEAVGLGWRMRFEAWRATRVAGDIAVSDPDGIVQEARFVPNVDCMALLGAVAPWVRDPVEEWLQGPWIDRRTYRYAVHGQDRSTAEVVRLHL
jgi:8-oxo-dGTP diphosphatase